MQHVVELSRGWGSVVSLSIAVACGLMPAQRAARKAEVATAVYEANVEDFPNPERGFFIQRGYNPLRGEEGLRPLSVIELSAARRQGISLVRRNYLLSEFRETELPQAMLAYLSQEFGRVRGAGLKLIPRFAYNFGPMGEPDASAGRILGHIGQLKPVLVANSDVIAFMDAGFVGAWGEWHTSTHGLFDSAPGVGRSKVNEKTRAIVAALLEALPPDRMITLRYPRHKMDLFGPEPLTSEEAFSGSAKARTGAENDCFLASKRDMGTYTDTSRMEAEKAYLHQDNLFVPMGGETCNAKEDAQPYIGCANALRELAHLRYTALNIDYERTVLKGWETGGCMAEIRRRLGYRFRLLEAEVSRAVAPGGTLRLRFTVANGGWGSLYNPRPLHIVLRHAGTRREWRLETAEDARSWRPGETKTVELSPVLPVDLPGGSYEVLLHLPDAAANLRQRAEYAVRLANKAVWEPATGMNSFRLAVEVRERRDP